MPALQEPELGETMKPLTIYSAVHTPTKERFAGRVGSGSTAQSGDGESEMNEND